MRTVRCSGHLEGLGVCVCLGGVYACENITFPQQLLRMVKNVQLKIPM